MGVPIPGGTALTGSWPQEQWREARVAGPGRAGVGQAEEKEGFTQPFRRKINGKLGQIAAQGNAGELCEGLSHLLIKRFPSVDNYCIRFALSETPSAGWAVIFVFEARLAMSIKALNQFLKIIEMLKEFLEKNRVSLVSGIM